MEQPIMKLPTIEQLEEKFDALHHVQENIENEKMWFWYGIRAYCKLLSELAHEDWLKCKAEMQQDINGFVVMQDSKPA